MPNTCPQCQRPVRAGAKFCGFCGTTLVPAQSVSPGPALAATAPSASVGGNCPHCNAPLRPGVKFCASCGKPVTPTPAAAPPPPAGPLPPSISQAQPVPAPPPPPTPTRAGAARDRRRKRSRGRFVLYLVPLLILCVLIGLPAGYFGWQYRHQIPVVKDWFATATPTEIIIESQPPTPTSSDTPAPATDTPTPTATLEFTSTPTFTPTSTEVPPTPTSTIAPPLITDTFDSGTTMFWEVLAVTGTFTVTSDDNPAGLLIFTNLDQVSIGSRQDQIPFAPGVVISFTVDMEVAEYITSTISGTLTDPELLVIWSPDIPTGITGTLPLTLWIRQDLLTIRLEPVGEEPRMCEGIELSDNENSFRIQVNDANVPSFFINDVPINDAQDCPDLSAPLPPFDRNGRLFFMGIGLIDDIYVAVQP